jgi:lipid-A-disaccharide synthase-like uncharacterized protein
MIKRKHLSIVFAVIGSILCLGPLPIIYNIYGGPPENSILYIVYITSFLSWLALGYVTFGELFFSFMKLIDWLSDKSYTDKSGALPKKDKE